MIHPRQKKADVVGSYLDLSMTYVVRGVSMANDRCYRDRTSPRDGFAGSEVSGVLLVAVSNGSSAFWGYHIRYIS